VLREALGIVATSVALAPALVAARFSDAATRGALGIPGALAALGIAERPCEVIALTGGHSNAVYELRFAHATLVLKHALETGSILARGARLCGPQPYPIDLSPAARTQREAVALDVLARAGVCAPRVIAVNAAAGMLLLEHVPGVPLPRVRSLHGIFAYRAALDAAHAAGLVLNDAHPGNALVDGGRIVLIDLEYAERSNDPDRRAFDLAFAAAYLTPAERRVFLRDEHDLRVAAATCRLARYAPMFAYEAARQRAAS